MAENGKRAPGKGGDNRSLKEKDLETPPEPWERQEGESEEAFEAFQIYRDQDPPRSLRRAAKEVGKSFGLVSRWSHQKDWVARSAAWDREQDRIKREADLKGQVQMVQRHGKEAAELQDALLMPARELVKRWEKARDAGEDPFKSMSTHDLVKEATKAARVYAQVGIFERLARGLSTTNVGGHEGGPLEVDHRERVERMPREEIEAYLLGVDAGAKRVAEKHGLPAPQELG